MNRGFSSVLLLIVGAVVIAGGLAVSQSNMGQNVITGPKVPSLTFSANPVSILAGESSTLTWSASNVSSCAASGAWSGAKSLSGSEAVFPATDSTYILTCTATAGRNKTVSKSVTVSVFPQPAPTVTVSANPLSIVSGDSTTLNWSSTNATSCTASWGSPISTSGSQIVSPAASTAYTVICTGPGGTGSGSVTVTVTAPADTTPPAVTITSPLSGAVYTATRGVAINATASDNVGVYKVEFYDNFVRKFTDFMPPYSYTWYFTGLDNGNHSWTAKAYDAAGNSTVSSAVDVTVNIPPVPTITISASPSSIVFGQSSTLTWSSTDTNTCTGWGGWIGPKPTSGTQEVAPTSTINYILACTGDGGSATSSATIFVQ